MKDVKYKEYGVLMSIYNKEKSDFFKLSIESILNQSITPKEIIIVKDGKLNEDLNIVIDQYVNSYSEIIRVVESKKNIGLGKALNLGLLEAKCELIARMDTDDIAIENRCELQLKEFNKDNDLIIVGSWVDEFDGNPKNIISRRKVPLNHKDIKNFSKRRSPFNHPTVMYKKSKVLECSGYKDLRRNQDVDLFGRMLFRGYKAKNISKSLVLFRANNNLLKRRRSWDNTRSYISVIFEFYKIGHSSILDLLVVSIAQVGMFLVPIKFQQYIYKKFLRR